MILAFMVEESAPRKIGNDLLTSAMRLPGKMATSKVFSRIAGAAREEELVSSGHDGMMEETTLSTAG